MTAGGQKPNGNVSPGAPTLDAIQAARKALAAHILRTPLIRMYAPDAAAEIYLKLENLQPIGAYKVRSMGYATLKAVAQAGGDGTGVYTASSGNAGLGLAWMASKLGVPATVYAPDSAPAGKLQAVRALGAHVELLSFDRWWEIIVNAGHPDAGGTYVDAVRSPAALAANAAIGVEIIEDLPAVDAVVVPFGGGGVACGVAAGLRALHSHARVLGAESEASTPLTAALAAGRPVPVSVRPSFISGIGGHSVLTEMWPLIQDLIDGTVVASLSAVCAAIRALFEGNRIVAEGAAATAVAGALSAQAGGGKVVCVVTGGNIDRADLIRILEGEMPRAG